MTVDEEFLAAMYGHDDEDETPSLKPAEAGAPPIPDRGIMSLPALSHLARQQAQMLATLGRAFAEYERRVTRLEGRVRAMERHMGQVGKALNSLDSEMSNKIDKRGWE